MTSPRLSSMLAPVRLAIAAMDPTAVESLQSFLAAQWMPDGGTRGRGETSDLYYTVFALACHAGLGRTPPPGTSAYLDTFGTGADLDFVHLACLARAQSLMDGGHRNFNPTAVICERIERYRCADGGYNQSALDSSSSSPSTGQIYEGFLAWLAYSESGITMPRLAEFERWMRELDLSELESGITPVIAGAVVMLAQSGRDVPSCVADWLLSRHHPQGGFLAAPGTPSPDLLSTATALQALAVLKHPIGPIRSACLEFVESLWTYEGGFRGHAEDQVVDCEYTYYGLLALGHLLEVSPVAT